MIYLLILIFAVAVIYAGYCNAIMDLITPLDRLAYRGFIWSKTAMEFSKDANKDGKISWWESSFPKDMWHVHKRRMNISVSTACSTLLPIGYLIKGYSVGELLTVALSVLCVPVFFVGISASFEWWYDKYK